jgi:hypothetical protein
LPSTSTTAAAILSVRRSFRRTSPSPELLEFELAPTALSKSAPSGRTLSILCGMPRSEGSSRLSDPLRLRDELFEISARSSISMTTVRMSPGTRARASPRRNCWLPPQSEAVPAGEVRATGSPGKASIARSSAVPSSGVNSGDLAHFGQPAASCEQDHRRGNHMRSVYPASVHLQPPTSIVPSAMTVPVTVCREARFITRTRSPGAPSDSARPSARIVSAPRW